LRLFAGRFRSNRRLCRRVDHRLLDYRRGFFNGGFDLVGVGREVCRTCIRESNAITATSPMVAGDERHQRAEMVELRHEASTRAEASMPPQPRSAQKLRRPGCLLLFACRRDGTGLAFSPSTILPLRSVTSVGATDVGGCRFDNRIAELRRVGDAGGGVWAKAVWAKTEKTDQCDDGQAKCFHRCPLTVFRTSIEQVQHVRDQLQNSVK